MQLIRRQFHLKVTRIIFSLLAFIPVIACAQQPVLKSKQVNSAQGSMLPLQSGAHKASKQEYKGQVKNDIKSIDATLTDDAEVVLVQTNSAQKSQSLAPDGVNINFLPLYGQYAKTDIQRVEDAIFLADCEKNFDSKEEASKFFSKMAWGYLSEGGKDLAMHRFNLAYLLDPNNQDVYWGLGVVSYQKDELHQAMDLLQKGIELSPIGKENPTMLVDLASIYIKCFTGHHQAKELESAYELLDKALLINPRYTNAYMQLSLANLANDDLDQAWINFHQGYEVDPSQADAKLLEELLAKSEDPKGIFK